MSAALQWVLALAARVGAEDARMADVAVWVGAHEDPTGFGEQLSADEPAALAGAAQVSVLGRPGAGVAEVVVVQLAEDERPTVDELEDALGPAEESGPFPSGDRLLVFPRPELAATVVARVDDEDEATELSIRRDR